MILEYVKHVSVSFSYFHTYTIQAVIKMFCLFALLTFYRLQVVLWNVQRISYTKSRKNSSSCITFVIIFIEIKTSAEHHTKQFFSSTTFVVMYTTRIRINKPYEFNAVFSFNTSIYKCAFREKKHITQQCFLTETQHCVIYELLLIT